MAKALDKYREFVWVRNKDRLDYGIPLPIKSDNSSAFYPDFLWWVKGTIWAIDPTGNFLLQEKVRTKLLNVPEPVKIVLLTEGKRNENHQILPEPGWTLVRRRLSNVTRETFDTLEDVFDTLINES